jgi:hypothetical protein
MQLQVVLNGNVIPFAPRAAGVGGTALTGARLSMRDRMDVTSWQEPARACGYDRLVIHERTPCDPPDIDSFLSIYRHGESWSRWGIARCGASVLAWCSVSGKDFGRFASVSEALGSLLGVGGAMRRETCEIIPAFA